MHLQEITYEYFLIFQQVGACFTHCSLPCFSLFIYVTDQAKSVKENIPVLFDHFIVFHRVEVL